MAMFYVWQRNKHLRSSIILLTSFPALSLLGKSFASRTFMSLKPLLANRYAIEQPHVPPPMMRIEELDIVSQNPRKCFNMGFVEFGRWLVILYEREN